MMFAKIFGTVLALGAGSLFTHQAATKEGASLAGRITQGAVAIALSLGSLYVIWLA